MAKSLELINKLATLLSAKYAMKELGDVAWFLGCRATRYQASTGILGAEQKRFVWALWKEYDI
jgi:hypothetical protein